METYYYQTILPNVYKIYFNQYVLKELLLKCTELNSNVYFWSYSNPKNAWPGHKFVENFKGDVQFWWAWYNGCYYYVNETITSVEIIKNIGPMNKRIGIGWAKCKYKNIPWNKITFHPGYIVEGTYYLEKKDRSRKFVSIEENIAFNRKKAYEIVL